MSQVRRMQFGRGLGVVNMCGVLIFGIDTVNTRFAQYLATKPDEIYQEDFKLHYGSTSGVGMFVVSNVHEGDPT